MATYSGTDVLWHGEPIKVVIHFDSNTTYTVYSVTGYDSSGNYIKKIDFNLSEGNNRVNPLGIATSNSISMSIFDIEDRLSPDNIDSPYYGKTVNGVKVEVFISYDGENWTPYGIYYTVSWSGSFSEGYHNFVNVSAEDKMNTIGNMDMPEIPAYSGIYSANLIGSVMEGIGLSQAEYYVDERINEQMTYGITTGSKVRDFMNNICQLLFARVIIDRSGRVCFVPALDTYENANVFELTSGETGALSNKNTNNINYNRLRVKYLVYQGTGDRAEIFRATRSLSVGLNSINDIQFSKKALSIEQVKALFDKGNSTALIDNIYYTGFQNGIQLHVNVTGEAISSCEFIGSGVTISTTDAFADLSIGNASVIGGSTFEFDTKQIMDETKANEIALKLRAYLTAVSRNIGMSGTVLSPRLYVGDKIEISSTGTMYDGLYKVTNEQISMGEDYSMSLNLIRVEEEEAAE